VKDEVKIKVKSSLKISETSQSLRLRMEEKKRREEMRGLMMMMIITRSWRPSYTRLPTIVKTFAVDL
jgi:hypothetical protein